jgi:hypothetical protein
MSVNNQKLNTDFIISNFLGWTKSRDENILITAGELVDWSKELIAEYNWVKKYSRIKELDNWQEKKRLKSLSLM